MSLGAVAVSPRMGDSVGAQLVYGMSKMSFSGERSSGGGGVGGFGYGQHTGGNNSSYTGAVRVLLILLIKQRTVCVTHFIEMYVLKVE